MISKKRQAAFAAALFVPALLLGACGAKSDDTSGSSDGGTSGGGDLSGEVIVSGSSTVAPISNAVREGKVHHAYLFSGPRGCGKTSTLRLQTFRTPDFGVLGQADADEVVWYRKPLRRMAPYADLACLGAAFLLLETRAVTWSALLFGTTWVVNAIVFAGVLIVVLLVVLSYVYVCAWLDDESRR